MGYGAPDRGWCAVNKRRGPPAPFFMSDLNLALICAGGGGVRYMNPRGIAPWARAVRKKNRGGTENKRFFWRIDLSVCWWEKPPPFCAM
jgi:hypothetical protein